jgi:HEPN domain-containing protein
MVRQWVDRAEYDLDAARAMNRSGHLLYVVFMCQQASEKILKALWCHRREDTPPFSHNLAVLSEGLGLTLSGEQQRLLDRLTRHYIVGRYPTFKQKLSESLSRDDASGLLDRTEEFVTWCRKSIPT